jgi:hypothetical protein
MFVTIIFASEAHKVLRYTDEGEATEVCKWTVDLSSLPTFIQNSNMHSGGFYTGSDNLPFQWKLSSVVPEFELGLELDNAEVRGVLMYKGRTWGRQVPFSESMQGLIKPQPRVTLDFF